MKTVVELKDIEASLPADWSVDTDRVRTTVVGGLREILVGLSCECNGKRRASDSVATTVQERIRALALVRCVDTGLKEIAGSRGVDCDVASHAEITAAVTPDEVTSLIAVESLLTKETIDKTVTIGEKAAIQSEELTDTRLVRDPDWQRDLAQLVTRATPHMIMDTVYDGASGTQLLVAKTVSVKLATLTAEVDENGEVCAWIYEES